MTEPLLLNKANRISLARVFNDIPRVDMSISCVPEGQMGHAFVDNAHNLQAFKIQIGPFFYLAGDTTNEVSCKVAEKLGYLPIGQYQAYYLK